ncbi:MAG: GTPase HflX [Bacteroidales bacterium]|nr:GTPase HflX [Bacteroidales bacterium]
MKINKGTEFQKDNGQEKIEKKYTDKAVFVGLIKQGDEDRKIKEYLDELEFLAETAGAIPDKQFIQRVDRPDSATYIRSGKLQEISDYCEENDIEYVIFDDELSGIQQRNIEKIIKTAQVIDRTSLILEIFAQRAKTAYAKMQVDLAKYNYILPRLAGMWTHLERQRGGMGTRGGMGETQIEIDRRIVKDRINKLKEQLKKVDRQMATQRGNRGSLVRLSLVGYTNVGKSTLMNLLAKSDVFAENKLFATLDTTVRKVVIENVPFLLSDTVGFIRKLPTQLVEAFKSTLDEVREADILVHVVDVSHPDFEEQMTVVEQTLKDIGANDKPVFVIFNKVDNYKSVEYDEFSLEPKGPEHVTLDELKNSWIAKEKTPCIFISAKEKIGIDKLRSDLYKMVAEIHAGRYPFDNFLW